MNLTILVGHLTKDPERVECNESVLCKMNIATNSNYTKNGERPVQFHNVVVWKGLAENCLKYLKKGSRCAVVGEMQTRCYESNGEKKYATEVVAKEVEFLGNPVKKEETTQKFEPVNDDNLPF